MFQHRDDQMLFHCSRVYANTTSAPQRAVVTWITRRGRAGKPGPCTGAWNRHHTERRTRVHRLMIIRHACIDFCRFTMVYRYTRNVTYLHTAMRLADFFVVRVLLDRLVELRFPTGLV